MKLITLIAAVTLALLSPSAAATGEAEQQFEAMARITFGGESKPAYFVSIGSSLAVPGDITAYSGRRRLPVSGISFSTVGGIAPVLVGMPLIRKYEAMRVDAEDEGGVSWGWIAAGAALAVGIVAAASSSDGGGGNDEESTCVGNGDVIGPRPPPMVDPECGNGR